MRSLGHSPGFTLLAIAILALSNANRNGGKYGQASGPDFVDYQRDSTAFESMAAYAYEVTSVVAASRAEYAGVAAVSPDFFRVLGIQPVQGHVFRNAHAALVGANFWLATLRSRPAVR